MQIAEFLSRHYMNYWRYGLGTDTDINVFSVQLPAILTPKNSDKFSVVSDSGKEISRDFSGIITPPQAHATLTSPPPLAKIPRIMTNEMLAQSDATNQIPSTPSHFSHTKNECNIHTRPNLDHQLRHCSEDDAYMDDDDKENFPPAPLKNGETSEQIARFLFPENNIPTDRAYANTVNYAINRRPSHAPMGTASVAQTSSNSSPTCNEGLTEQGIIWNKINKEKYEFNRYKSPEICAEDPGGNCSVNMEQPPEYLFHPHIPISDTHQIRNPRIVEDLRPAAFSLTCPDGRVTEIFFNSSLEDQFFAKAYFPHATLTGFRDGILRSAEGRAYICFHFNPDDPRAFEVARLNLPANVTLNLPDQVASGPPAQPQPNGINHDQTQPQRTRHQPPLFVPPLPLRYEQRPHFASPFGTSSAPNGVINPRYRTFLVINPADDDDDHDDTVDDVLTLESAHMAPVPTFFHRNARLAYQESYTFNSVPAIDHEFLQGDEPDEFTQLEIDFLQHVLRYLDGAIELKDGLQIPDQFLEGHYLEGLGDEQHVSLRLPILDKLFVRAGKDFPESVLGIFMPNPFSVSSLLREPTPGSTTDNDELSSTDAEWMYLESPPPLAPLGLPLRGFDELQFDSASEQ